MRVIESPSPYSGVKLHLLSNGRLGVSHTSGVAHDSMTPAGQTGLKPPFTTRTPTIDADPDPTNGPPDAISALMQFLADKLEAPDLQQAQTLIEQMLSDTSDHPGGANPQSGMSMDSASRARRMAQRSAEAKGFDQRWPGAARIRSLG